MDANTLVNSFKECAFIFEDHDSLPSRILDANRIIKLVEGIGDGKSILL